MCRGQQPEPGVGMVSRAEQPGWRWCKPFQRQVGRELEGISAKFGLISRALRLAGKAGQQMRSREARDQSWCGGRSLGSGSSAGRRPFYFDSESRRTGGLRSGIPGARSGPLRRRAERDPHWWPVEEAPALGDGRREHGGPGLPGGRPRAAPSGRCRRAATSWHDKCGQRQLGKQRTTGGRG